MKRKLSCFFILVFSLTFFFGCQQQDNTDLGARKISVVVNMDCEESIYGMQFEYSINRQRLGGQLLSIDPEMSIPLPNEPKYVSFDERGFPSPDELTNGTFGILVYLILGNGDVVPLEYLYEWNANYGESYNFTLSGNAESGFIFVPTGSNTQYSITPFSELPVDFVE